MTQEKYNGYTNYETWLTGLWIDNDQELSEMVEELSKDAKDPYSLEESLKSILEELIQENDCLNNECFVVDLFNHAFAQINWTELANLYFEQHREVE